MGARPRAGCSRAGHTVLAGARDAERGRRTADELGAVFLEIDPTSDASVAAAAGRVRSEYGRLDVLVNNAGTAEPRVGAADLTAGEAMQGFGITCSARSGSRMRSCRSCAPRIIPGS
ncbi:MAG TPA: SDR family NAD(P)-dependent oxidoreductase [Streptosporangiaceae bacterium]|nr:SDR family NAD(P)-dependent oxidoreductase [Streptosporangiaceae bacterium]